MIDMEPMSSVVSDETLRILRRFYPPPDDTADKLLYKDDQYVRIRCGRALHDVETRMDDLQYGSSSVCASETEAYKETTETNHSVVVSGRQRG